MPGVAPNAGLPQDIQWQFEELDAMRKAYTETAVAAGPQLVREDLSAVVALEVNINTPVRNRLNRIKGRKSVALGGCMREALPLAR